MLEAISKRRSIRKYRPDSVEKHKIDEIVEAARLAPSCINLQHFRVLVVDRKEDLAVVRRAAYGWGAPMTAPVILVVMADLSADATLENRIGQLFEIGALDQVDIGELQSGSGKPFELRIGEQWATVNAAIAAEHMALQATDLGLGTCWVHHFNHEEVRQHFGIPDDLRLVTLMPLGYPDEDPSPRPRIADVRFIPDSKS